MNSRCFTSAISSRRRRCGFLVLFLLALAGCSHRAPEPVAPVSESTWRQVDADIGAASLAATSQARAYAEDAMQRWMDLVYQRTDSQFIPWFSSYWTQQWLSMKVAWYKLGSHGDPDPTVDRLAVYLQEQYRKQVLLPVAREVDPDAVMEQATRHYVELLAQALREIPQRRGVPQKAFDERLMSIPAIALGPPASRNASLYEVVTAKDIGKLPAFAALMQEIRSAAGKAGAGTRVNGVSPVARRTSAKLVSELKNRSVAGVVASAAGKVAGSVISVAFTLFSVASNDHDRPEVEGQLRKEINAAFDEQWLALMRDPEGGVMAGVDHLGGQVQDSLVGRLSQPEEEESETQSFGTSQGPPIDASGGFRVLRQGQGYAAPTP
ncbi:hypothetical protein NK553_01485 [Pseudomonas sp. ZM23]|uniref:Lipoprotein n=1 Tax=Pseudomonas triclosanedens TaxID=2961893 RepID=A0ABY7A0J4_9PSED|nr:hypothetical protein [Pseudomonas triclosanedens]MCP8462610.1 hypothetical protein [Pseudomonas triclosanedens]MCP8468229.1 hypothetical protein [Pseudomonas triclosanedens]MCP8474988.1 hypothetical protein [Pseudomonas triclosanedens]WAI49800.1 hypothetical protein OU419_00610 [Pseudomonas triclosanedens]